MDANADVDKRHTPPLPADITVFLTQEYIISKLYVDGIVADDSLIPVGPDVDEYTPPSPSSATVEPPALRWFASVGHVAPLLDVCAVSSVPFVPVNVSDKY